MDLEKIRKYISAAENDYADGSDANDEGSKYHSCLPHRFFEPFVLHGIQLETVEPGRILFSFIVSPRLVNKAGNRMHSGAIATIVDWVGASVVYTVGASSSGVSVEINTSFYDQAYLGDEIDIDARASLVGKFIGIVNVELRNKSTQKLIARGRHTMYMAVSSKL